MLARRITPVLRARLADYPAVAVVGPRQCGKTTLASSLGGRYFDLEQEPDRLSLDLTWEEAVGGRELVVLDEAQAWPEVFPRLRGAIDSDRGRNGRFLLLGSVSPALMTQVSESLAGRLSVLQLTPLLWPELTSDRQRQRLWLFGGYPDGGVLNGKRFPVWQGDYLNLLALRDLPNVGSDVPSANHPTPVADASRRSRPGVERQPTREEPGALLPYGQRLPRLPGRRVSGPPPARIPRQHPQAPGEDGPRCTGGTRGCFTRR